NSFEGFLLAQGFVTKETLDKLKSLRGTKAADGSISLPGDLGSLLVTEKLMDEEDLAKAKAAFFNIPYIDLRKKEIRTEVLELIPRESSNFYNLAAFEREGNTLKVAVTDPSNLSALGALEFLGQKQNLQIQLHLASVTSVDVAIGRKHNLT